jgi:hypothetical protein
MLKRILTAAALAAAPVSAMADASAHVELGVSPVIEGQRPSMFLVVLKDRDGATDARPVSGLPVAYLLEGRSGVVAAPPGPCHLNGLLVGDVDRSPATVPPGSKLPWCALDTLAVEASVTRVGDQLSVTGRIGTIGSFAAKDGQVSELSPAPAPFTETLPAAGGSFAVPVPFSKAFPFDAGTSVLGGGGASK